MLSYVLDILLYCWILSNIYLYLLYIFDIGRYSWILLDFDIMMLSIVKYRQILSDTVSYQSKFIIQTKINGLATINDRNGSSPSKIRQRGILKSCPPRWVVFLLWPKTHLS